MIHYEKMVLNGRIKDLFYSAKPGGESTIGFVTFRSAKEAMEVVNVSLEMKDNPLTLSLAPNTKVIYILIFV